MLGKTVVIAGEASSHCVAASHDQFLRFLASAAGLFPQVVLLRDLCGTMVDASLCAMGGMTPLPVLSALDHYASDFGLGDGD